ncbi:MAG: glucosaminidase domain-containing protein [Chitinophagaceae bacterium]|nr:glucosaminidase domain-containing protein [Chitinophagaceae bacterium]
MTKKSFLLIFTGLVISHNILMAQNEDVVQYINTYKFLAIREMQRTGVPAAIKLAQGILETRAGASDLVKRSNNHFGIKCKTGWAGSKVYHDDDERGECFRAYATAEDSYRDHSDFLKGSQRYAFLFQLDPTDYKDWAKGLKKAGYATNPKYTQQLIKYIEDYDLQLYTLVALGKKKLDEGSPALAGNNILTTQQPGTPVAASVSKGAGSSTPAKPVEPLRIRFPEGIFKINDTKVMVAVAGTSLLSIAEQYDIKYKHLLDFNELAEGNDILREDQLVFLQRKRRQGANKYHLVTQGETLYSIAQEEAIRLDFLLAYNRLHGQELPMEGQLLFLQKSAAEEVMAGHGPVGSEMKEGGGPRGFSATEVITEQQYQKHIVQAKETLFSIARKYDVNITQIRSWNGLRDNTIRSGQELLIYKN